jgi:hypothetical protein
VIFETLPSEPAELARATGWTIKAQGACKGDVCVPLFGEERTDARAFASKLGMAVISDGGVTAVGPETVMGRALTTAEAPDFTLPDWKGGEFTLSSLRGQKVFLLAWASW